MIRRPEDLGFAYSPQPNRTRRASDPSSFNYRIEGIERRHKFGNSGQRQMAVAVEHFRELGIDDGVTKQFLTGQKVSPQEYQAVANLKRELMGDADFVKKYLGGDVKSQQHMTTINAVLVNGVK